MGSFYTKKLNTKVSRYKIPQENFKNKSLSKLFKKPPGSLFILIFDAHRFLVDALSQDLLKYLGYRNNVTEDLYGLPLRNFLLLPEGIQKSLTEVPISMDLTSAKLVTLKKEHLTGVTVKIYRIVSTTVVRYAAFLGNNLAEVSYSQLNSFILYREGSVLQNSVRFGLDEDTLQSLLCTFLMNGLVYQKKLDSDRFLLYFADSQSQVCCYLVNNRNESDLESYPKTSLLSPSTRAYKDINRIQSESFSTEPILDKKIFCETDISSPTWNIIKKSQGTIVMDMWGRIISVNQQILSFLGTSMDTLLYKDVQSILASAKSKYITEKIKSDLSESLNCQLKTRLWSIDQEREVWKGLIDFYDFMHKKVTCPVKIIHGLPKSENFTLFVTLPEDYEVNLNKLEIISKEEENLDTESQLKAIIDTSVDAIITINSLGKVKNFNRSAELMFGYTSNEVSGKNVKMLMPEPYRSQHDVYIKQYLKTGINKVIGIGREALALRKNGTTFPMEFAVSEAKLNGKIYFTGIIRDISDRKEAEIALEKERQKSEQLLLSILPKQIAERLKQEQNKVIADRFDNASVLFCDLVGFTSFSSNVAAEDLVLFLNRIYSMFDELVDHHEVTKIKTIGDAYMVVSGVPERVTNHQTKLANFALDMIQCVDLFNSKYKENINIRIGINCGPLVGGVIGKKQFSYDIWGDTVNVASRMESVGVPGKIHVSQTFYEKLQDDFLFKKRGNINVKGKGEMETYFLLGPKKTQKKYMTVLKFLSSRNEIE